MSKKRRFEKRLAKRQKLCKEGGAAEEEFKELSARERYWHRRYSLFSLFDLGIQLDEESFYSVTPEVVAAHHASRLSSASVVLDACCGVGGNTIQFALKCDRVIGVDCDPAKLVMAKENSEIYGVASKIEWVNSVLV